jgi:hypothetical protein
MFKQYSKIINRHKNLSLKEERTLIRRAKNGDVQAQQKLLLHHIGFFIFRIRTALYFPVVREFGSDILQECLLWTPRKIQSYNLRYRNKKGIFQPVLLRTYLWKGVTGLMFQYVRKNRKGRYYSDSLGTAAQQEDG